jgi:aarF domain-containing kinase
MRTVFFFGRLSRQGCNHHHHHIFRAAFRHQRPFSHSRSLLRILFNFKSPPPPPGVKRLLLAGATLSPAAFVSISEGDNGDGKTGEEQMLAASREELKQQVPKVLENSKGFRRRIYFFVDTYIVEPICTGLRFLHLVFIFVPVMATVPIVWFGARNPDRDNERGGTLWWYGFLVRSMERAGAAFIKVNNTAEDNGFNSNCLIHSSDNGPLQGQTFSQTSYARLCPRCTPTLPHTLWLRRKEL